MAYLLLMAHNLDPISQYRLVHEGIRAVAARCDGAVTLDMKGFDGQDTAYGRRIAGVLFEKLTADHPIDPKWQGELPHTVVVAPGGRVVYRSDGAFDPLALRKAIVGYYGRYYHSVAGQ